ncbi:hypothetical protein N8529_00790 [bacterium]|nr:hypothetical protein [bacterium]
MPPEIDGGSTRFDTGKGRPGDADGIADSDSRGETGQDSVLSHHGL